MSRCACSSIATPANNANGARYKRSAFRESLMRARSGRCNEKLIRADGRHASCSSGLPRISRSFCVQRQGKIMKTPKATRAARMHAVVTGGAGFLGSHLCARLVADGFSVLAIDNLVTGDLQNLETLLGQPG